MNTSNLVTLLLWGFMKTALKNFFWINHDLDDREQSHRLTEWVIGCFPRINKVNRRPRQRRMKDVIEAAGSLDAGVCGEEDRDGEWLKGTTSLDKSSERGRTDFDSVGKCMRWGDKRAVHFHRRGREKQIFLAELFTSGSFFWITYDTLNRGSGLRL